MKKSFEEEKLYLERNDRLFRMFYKKLNKDQTKILKLLMAQEALEKHIFIKQ